MNFKVIEGDFAPQTAKYGIVVARFNSFIVESLLSGAIDALKRHGGVKEEDIPFLAESAKNDACTPGNPRDVSQAEIEEIYRSIL